MNALAIVEAATAEGLVVDLSPSGSIKVVGEQEVVNRWRAILKQHKTEIVKLLNRKPGGAIEAARPTLPTWCNGDCEHYHRLELPDVGTMQWCCQENDEKHWRIARIFRMNGCPMAIGAPDYRNKIASNSDQ